MDNCNHKYSNIFFRILAKLIDLIIVAILWKIFHEAGILAGVFYLLISDGIFHGSSIGKKFLRLKVININKNSSADFRDSIIRNITVAFSLLFLPLPIIGWLICTAVFAFEFILIVGDSDKRRLGDHLAKTSVIEE